jgi:hypothetical protein
MNRILRIAVLVLITAVILPRGAAADFWARTDRPWTSFELNQAIAFCRIQARVDPNIGFFVDMVMGRQIDKCMHALGWIGVAR